MSGIILTLKLLLMSCMQFAVYAIYILAVVLLVHLLRITRWYIKENNIPGLFPWKKRKRRHRDDI